MRSFLIMLLPSFLKIYFLNFIKGNRIEKKVRIGFSYIKVKNIILEEGAQIGHFNFIRSIHTLKLEKNAQIQNFNRASQFHTMHLHADSKIASLNVFGGDLYYNHGEKKFVLGEKSTVTIGHRFDLVDNIFIGYNTVIAGASSQFYTHSFDLKRERLQWTINVGDNCYIGTRAIVLSSICNNVVIGAGTSVHKEISEPGLWISSSLLRAGDANNFSEKGIFDSYEKDGYTFWIKK